MKRANHCHILQVTRYLLLPVVLIAIMALSLIHISEPTRPY